MQPISFGQSIVSNMVFDLECIDFFQSEFLLYFHTTIVLVPKGIGEIVSGLMNS